MEIKDLAGLSKPLTRLIEVVSAGVGAVSQPYLIRRNAEAKAHEIRIISNALREVAQEHQLPVTYKEGDLEIWQKPEDGTLVLEQVSPESRIEQRLDYQERKRQRNIEQVTAVAAAELAEEVEVPDGAPDEDWVTRFFASVQDISSEQMQELWGRILAGEIKQPGAYSFRTLEFLRNLTRPDAALIEKLSALTVYYKGTPIVAAHDKAWLEKHRGVYPGHHFAMGELGAMYPTDLNYRFFREESTQEEVIFAGSLILLLKRGEVSGEIQLPVWKFTAVGQDLLRLIPAKHEADYLESIGVFFVKKKAVAVLCRVLEKLQNGQLRYQPLKTIVDPTNDEHNSTNA